jgi:hypothetical protein
LTEERPPERTSQSRPDELQEELRKTAGNGGEGGVRGVDPLRHTEHAPSRRYRLLMWVVAIAFVAIVIYLAVDSMVGE